MLKVLSSADDLKEKEKIIGPDSMVEECPSSHVTRTNYAGEARKSKKKKRSKVKERDNKGKKKGHFIIH